MVTAEITFSKAELSSLRYPMTLVGVGWNTYEDISEELGESARVSQSSEIPLLTGAILTEFLKRGRNEEEQFKLLTDFQDWLKSAK